MGTDKCVAEAKEFCDTLTEEQDDMARELLSRVAGKWPLCVLYVLAEEGAPLRFSRVHERIEGIGQKMLTQTLRQLERDGLITRTLFAQVPPRVDYDLTPLGFELLAQVLPLWRWVAEHVGVFEAARKRFDKAAAAA